MSGLNQPHRIADQPQWEHGGFSVFLCSSAGVSTGALLCLRDQILVIDAGDGLGRDIADRGIAAEQIAGVLISHDHGDHVTGIPGLLWWMHVQRRATPLVIHRPGDAPLLDALLATYPARFAGTARFAIDTRSHAPTRLGPFEIEPFAARHRRSSSDPDDVLMEAFGFEVRAAHQRVVFSGDTGPSPQLARRVVDADLAILEATFEREDERDHVDTHLTVQEATAMGRTARHAILCHRRCGPRWS